ncbi:hypothetical protein [Nonomuraea sp. SBT364]|uniref:hypothetical protein n=1 Tax=Nonomuraea sp. SBT364 TaxID=1580530 RepID=UPI00066D703F|nr:hypothetical protein [Nonomuraea sp. SBT364]
MPSHLWLAGATVVAVAITVLMTEGQVPPGAVLLPPADTPSASDPADSPSGRDPGATPDRREPAGTPTAQEGGTAPTARGRTTPTPGEPTATAGRPSAAPTANPTAAPTSRGPAAGPPSVREAGILAWDGSAGSVRVLADGPGPVRLRISYMRREDGGEAREVGRETRTLTGRTEYTAAVGRAAAAVPCGRRAYLAILAMTEPAAANGPQVGEVAVDGPPCPTHRATPTATPTAPALSPAPRTPSGDQPSQGAVPTVA